MFNMMVIIVYCVIKPAQQKMHFGCTTREITAMLIIKNFPFILNNSVLTIFKRISINYIIYKWQWIMDHLNWIILISLLAIISKGRLQKKNLKKSDNYHFRGGNVKSLIK